MRIEREQVSAAAAEVAIQAAAQAAAAAAGRWIGSGAPGLPTVAPTADSGGSWTTADSAASDGSGTAGADEAGW
jgi:hypothetical protein